MRGPALACLLVVAGGCRCDQPGGAGGPEPSPEPAARAGRVHRVVHSLGPSSAGSIEERMEMHHVPGASVAVVHDGALDWAEGFGRPEAGTSRSVGTNTLFQAASVSKPVAAAVALRLVDQGRLDLDRDVNDILTSWKVEQGGDTATEKVTTRRILSHRAGLTVHGFEGYTRDGQVPTLVEVLDGSGPANSGPVRVDVLPGSITRYSGGGYCVLEKLLEDLTGKGFPALARELAIVPAGMESSTFAQPLPSSHHALASSGHHGDGTVVAGGWRVHPERAAAGLWTTPTDMARFLLAVMESLDGGSGTLLSRSAAAGLAGGLGFMAGGTGSRSRFFHGGSNVGFRCFAIAFPARKQGAVIMTNSESGDRLIEELLRSISSEYGWPAWTD